MSVVVNLKYISYFFGVLTLGFWCRNYWSSKIILWWLIFEKKQFLFWREIWIQVLLILLHLYIALFLSRIFVWVFEIGRFKLFPSTLCSTFIPEAFVCPYLNTVVLRRTGDYFAVGLFLGWIYCCIGILHRTPVHIALLWTYHKGLSTLKKYGEGMGLDEFFHYSAIISWITLDSVFYIKCTETF